MRISDFDYELPDELIATHPPAERRASRLLHINAASGELSDRQFADLPSMLQPDDLLVFNDTRVIRARLHGYKDTGGKVEVLIERQLDEYRALAHIKASKSPKPNTRIELQGGCSALVSGREGALFKLHFDRDVAGHLAAYGEVPLPPYLGREEESADGERYQTVYAREDGAVAAPTAGLHFDEAMLQQTLEGGVDHGFVTLHVGAGTFQSLRHDVVIDNQLHAERIAVEQAVCDAVSATRARGGRVIAVGTTTVRSLETAAAGGELQPFDGESRLFIVPGYKFRVVDCLLTNFHLPQSSLLMLVAAFAGHDRILDAYQHAVREKYRFFSYGDAMFINAMPEARA